MKQSLGYFTLAFIQISQIGPNFVVEVFDEYNNIIYQISDIRRPTLLIENDRFNMNILLDIGTMTLRHVHISIDPAEFTIIIT